MSDTTDFEYHPVDFVTGQPYAQWARARAESPLIDARSSILGGDDRPYFEVTRREDVERVLRDATTFSSAINGEHMGPFMGELMLAMDGPEHRAYRNLVAHAFRASQLAQWEETLVASSIQECIDEVAPLGRAELVRDVTKRYPARVICSIVGVPAEDSDRFQAWAEVINGGPLHPEEGLAASQAMQEYLAPLVEARRAEPCGDLLSDLVHAEVDGERLSEARLYGFLKLLLPAGAETTYRLMGNALTALLVHPGLMQRVVADRDLVPALIEETLRWETSVTLVSRNATVDTEIAGCPVPAGSALGVVVGSANHDAAVYDRADEFDLDRPASNHVAFGTGPHQCLGMHLARMEMRTGLNAILDGLPNLRLDPDAPPPVIEGLAFRGPDALPVVFDPA